jgi:DNA polymerase III sliding clamp (beta) subunit (PCNA family)
MRSIGEVARATGLTVSALRFYDGAGILVPAAVDPQTGYRRYGDDQVQAARLVAALRRVDMPLAEIRLVLADRADHAAVRRLLDGHLRRLEDGLADARRALSRVHAMLDHEEKPMATRVTLASAELAAALAAVRFAVSTDPELPVLGGVLIEVEEDLLRLVATDRYRLAVSAASARAVSGPPVSVIAPVDLLDTAQPLLDEGEVTLVFNGDDISVQARGRTVSGPRLDHDFPDYRRLLRVEGAHRVTVDVEPLRQALVAGPTRGVVRGQDDVMCDVAVLSLDANGRLGVVAEDSQDGGDRFRVGVNREFFLEALTGSGRDELVLELDGPIKPLAVRVPDDDRMFSLLMPTRLP